MELIKCRVDLWAKQTINEVWLKPDGSYRIDGKTPDGQLYCYIGALGKSAVFLDDEIPKRGEEELALCPAVPPPHAYLAFVLGYWGRGKTLLEACERLKAAGARNTDMVIVKLVIGDDKPSVNSEGRIEYSNKAYCLDVEKFKSLSRLMNNLAE